jgi:hypothetical protein
MTTKTNLKQNKKRIQVFTLSVVAYRSLIIVIRALNVSISSLSLTPKKLRKFIKEKDG